MRLAYTESPGMILSLASPKGELELGIVDLHCSATPLTVSVDAPGYLTVCVSTLDLFLPS